MTTINDFKSFKAHLENITNEELMNDLKDKNYIQDDNTFNFKEGSPFNVFAAFAKGILKMNTDQKILGKYSENWIVCKNRAENDINWKLNSDKVSMAGPDENGPGHVFITTKNLHPKYFNIASIILNDEQKFLEDLLEVAKYYSEQRNWKNPGFYFHCYPNNSVNSLHLHVINLDKTGPSFELQNYKNLSIYEAFKMFEK